MTVGLGDDASLVREVLGGNVDAFGSLYDRYAGLIRAICHNEAPQDLHRAQDMCQEVFLRGYRNLATLKDPRKFAAWLMGIASLVCKESRRKRSRDRNRFVPEPPDQADDPQAAAATEDANRVLAAICELPERQRLALHLFYLQENPAEDARQILKLSRSGFYRLLDRASANLKSRIENDRKGNP